MKKILILVLILFTAAFVFAGGKKEAVEEKVLTVGVPDNARFLDTVANSDNVSERVMRNIHETLIEVAPDGNIVPRLAESWKQIDAKTVEFKLKKGIVSHAGYRLMQTMFLSLSEKEGARFLKIRDMMRSSSLQVFLNQ